METPQKSSRWHNDKTKEIFVSPHYLHDESYKHPKLTFGEYDDNVRAEYSDRPREWDYKKHEKAAKYLTTITATTLEQYLSCYYDKPIELKFVLAGFNWANGYPYQVFGFLEKNNNE